MHCWLVIQILKSIGGGACIFATPSGKDVESGSPPGSMLSVDPNGTLSCKTVVITLLETASSDGKEMSTRVAQLRAAGPEVKAALHVRDDGLTPRSSALLQVLKGGPLTPWIQEL